MADPKTDTTTTTVRLENLAQLKDVKAGTNVEMTQAFIDAQGRQRWVDRAVGLGVGLVTGGVAAGVAYRVGVNHGAASLETDVPATSSNRPVVAARG